MVRGVPCRGINPCLLNGMPYGQGRGTRQRLSSGKTWRTRAGKLGGISEGTRRHDGGILRLYRSHVEGLARAWGRSGKGRAGLYRLGDEDVGEFASHFHAFAAGEGVGAVLSCHRI